METYKFSKMWVLVNKVSRELLFTSVKISALIMVLGLIIYYLWDFPWLVVFPLGFPVMTYIFIRTAVTIYENTRILKFCKKVNLTVDEFNEIYGVKNLTS